MMILFKKRLLDAIDKHLTSPSYHYVDNSLRYYSSVSPKAPKAVAAMQEDKKWFTSRGQLSLSQFIKANAQAIDLHILTKAYLYDRLEDAHSRDTLLLAALYGLMGHRYVKFPYYAPDAMRRRAELHTQHAAEESDEAMRLSIERDAFGVGGRLSRYRVKMGTEPVTLYANAEFLYQMENFQTYRYDHDGVVVDVAPGDHVLDCGACYGDTALFFASKVGTGGRILSFEPHPGISRLYEYNRQVNPALAVRMELVRCATGRDETGELALTLRGPGSHVSDIGQLSSEVRVKVVSLDAEVARRGWNDVHFIKMDVEGAEQDTLIGAQGVLRRYRPKLAVCLYHNLKDFFMLPRFLDELGLGYRFYLEHHFMNEWETVLYAV